jgi:hypothetical protein
LAGWKLSTIVYLIDKSVEDVPGYNTIKEIPVPMRTTQRISTFFRRAIKAPSVITRRGRSQGIFKAKRMVMVKRRPTKEQRMPMRTLLK